MKIDCKRVKKNSFYEKLIISYKHENGKCLSAFTYVDSESLCSYTSQLFIQDTEWAAVKIATIYAQKYFQDNKIKNCNYFIQNVWNDFFKTTKESSEGI